MHRLKVWSSDRSRKFAVTFSAEQDFETVLQKACQKLKIVGVNLVAEDDGTSLTDEYDLLHYASIDKPVLLLEENEAWFSAKMESTIASTEVQDEPNESDNSNNEQQILSTNEPTDELHVQEIPVEKLDAGENEQISEEQQIINSMEAKRASFTSWREYRVPWKSISDLDLDRCRRGIEKDEARKNIVHAIVSDMRFYNVPIKMEDWRRVAVQCMNTFPKIFEDKDDDGSRLDNGYNSILRKFQDHYHYLGSISKKLPSLCRNLNIKLKHRRTLEAVKSGTIDWQPAQLPVGETEDSIETKRIALKSLHENEEIAPEVSGSVTENLLSATYCSQRLFLNALEKPPKIEKILETWPALFNAACLLWHFEKLTGVSMEKLRTNFEEKIKKILLYGKYKLRLELATELSLQERQHKAMEFLQIQFKEQETHLLRYCNFQVKPENLLSDVEYPVIAFRMQNEVHENDENESEEERQAREEDEKLKYLLFYDNKVVMKCETFTKALEALIATYFVFNKTYPKAHGCTMLFLQMYLLNIYTPDSICRAKSENCKRKVLTLFNALQKINITDFPPL